MVRVALLGCGRIAQMFHLRVLSQLAGVELVAIADADPARLAEASRRAIQARPLLDYREVIAATELDAVVLCLPTALHADAATRAFARGLHVYVEKPLAADLDQAARIVAAWQRAGTVGMVGFNFRFHPLYRALREAVAGGRLGRVAAARSVVSSAPRGLPEWKRRRASGGGVLLDLVSHHVDLTRFLFATEVAAVTAGVRSDRHDVDTAVVDLLLADGTPHQILASDQTAQQDRFEVFGERGVLAVDRFRSTRPTFLPAQPGQGRAERLRRGAGFLKGAPRALAETVVPPSEPSFATALAAFATSVRTGAGTAPTIADGYRCLEVIAAAEQAAAEGKTVTAAGFGGRVHA